MSDEKQEQKLEGWQQAEERDNQMILGMMSGVGAQLYVNDYPNKKGERVVELSIDGVHATAKIQGGLTVDGEIEIIEDEKTVRALCVVIDKNDGDSRSYGAATEKKGTNEHAWTLAIHKAERNGLEHHLKPEYTQRIMDQYFSATGTKPPALGEKYQPTGQSQQKDRQPQGNRNQTSQPPKESTAKPKDETTKLREKFGQCFNMCISDFKSMYKQSAMPRDTALKGIALKYGHADWDRKESKITELLTDAQLAECISAMTVHKGNPEELMGFIAEFADKTTKPTSPADDDIPPPPTSDKDNIPF